MSPQFGDQNRLPPIGHNGEEIRSAGDVVPTIIRHACPPQRHISVGLVLLDPPYSLNFTSSWSNRNAYMSTAWLICSASGVPMPWPVSELVRSKIGAPHDWAACSRAIIFRDCDGCTRGSFAPVIIRMAGKHVPFFTCSYGE